MVPTREKRMKAKKLVAMLFVVFLMVILNHIFIAVALGFLAFVTAIEIATNKTTILTKNLERVIIVVFEMLARIILALLYNLILIPMTWFFRKKIRQEMSPNVIKELEKNLEGCVCDIKFERGY